MATATKTPKSSSRVTRKVTQNDRIVYVGDDNGNNTHVMVYQQGMNGTPKTFTAESWIYEHQGSLDDLNPVSNSKGLTFTYTAGHSEFIGRTFMCGRAALAARGASKATLIGDDIENKVIYGLPMLLFGLASQIELGEEDEMIDAIVVSNTHKQSLAPRLKQSLSGTHEIDILSRDSQGYLNRSPLTISIRASVTKEGLGGLWKMSGSGKDGDNHLLEFEDMNLVCDGGGGTFDVLLVENGDFIRSDSVKIGGNDIVKELLRSESFVELFPSCIEIDRGLVETAIKDGSWTYSKGKVKVNFNRVGYNQILKFIPLWKSAIDDISAGNRIAKTALIGGLFQTRYIGEMNANGELEGDWSLSEMLQSEFINHDFVLPEKPQTTNAEGLFEMALDQAVGK